MKAGNYPALVPRDYDIEPMDCQAIKMGHSNGATIVLNEGQF